MAGMYSTYGTWINTEIEKVALGLNYRAVAFKGFNDAFLPGVQDERAADRGPLYRRLRLLIGARDLLCRLGLMEHGLITAIVFKDSPTAKAITKLKAAGFQLRHLEPNPYATR